MQRQEKCCHKNLYYKKSYLLSFDSSSILNYLFSSLIRTGMTHLPLDIMELCRLKQHTKKPKTRDSPNQFICKYIILVTLFSIYL